MSAYRENTRIIRDNTISSTEVRFEKRVVHTIGGHVVIRANGKGLCFSNTVDCESSMVGSTLSECHSRSSRELRLTGIGAVHGIPLQQLAPQFERRGDYHACKGEGDKVKG